MEIDKPSGEFSTKTPTVSSLPDFAQIFVFLQLFGATLNLSPVSIKDLEDFFIYGYKDESYENSVLNVHWRLVRNVTRSEGLREWQRMAVKFARKYGLVSENLPYSSLDIGTRVKLLRLACEDQFEFNVNFRKELKEFELMDTPCIGVDSNGQRHWLLQDSSFDIRLYGESDYDEEPPAEAKWMELARSLAGLGRYISTLEERMARMNGDKEGGGAEVVKEDGESRKDDKKKAEPKLNGVLDQVEESECDDEYKDTSEEVADLNSTADISTASSDSFSGTTSTCSLVDAARSGGTNADSWDGDGAERCEGGEGGVEHDSLNDTRNKPVSKKPRRKASIVARAKTTRKSREKTNGRGAKRMSVEPVVVTQSQDQGGCLKCHRDVDYEQMLLCDECDKECHTYCQYPRLWTIPKGKWTCPICNEVQLINALKAVHSRMFGAREQYERQLERKQKSVARLQKSGLLVQNIIEDADDGRRSRRCRKSVNYAELNDVYLPPLGPQDMVGKQDIAAAGFLPGTRSRTRRNDLYIQEDYLASRIRSVSTRRRRWRDVEEEGEEEEGQSEGGLEECRTISRSPDYHHGDKLEAIKEEEEDPDTNSRSSSRSGSLVQGWKPAEIVKKKPRFACLENDDLSPSPVDALVQQAFSPPPKQFHHLPVPTFQAPPIDDIPAPPIHVPAFSVPIAKVPSLPAPPVNGPSLFPPQNYTPSLPAPPVNGPSLSPPHVGTHSAPTPLSLVCGAPLTSPSNLCTSVVTPGNQYPPHAGSQSMVPFLHHQDETIERTQSALSPSNHSLAVRSLATEVNPLPQDQQT